MQEIWKHVPNKPYYLASNLGRIKRLEFRKLIAGRERRFKKRFLKSNPFLTLMTFKGPPPGPCTFKDRTHSKETKQKISAAKIGRKRSKETKLKISATLQKKRNKNITV